MINELFPSLPYDLEKPAPALAWAKQNWLPIALFIAGVVVV